MFLSGSIKSCAIKSALLAVLTITTACSYGPDQNPQDGIYDPFEEQNRQVHALNRGLDKALVRPAAKGYTAVLPDEIENVVGNVASNLGEPSMIVNSLLQADAQGFGTSTLRFVINSTFGILGMVDVASEWGISDHDTDFGETLHKWGASEGPYVELPVIGPSTQRDAWGIAVDLVLNPLSYVLGEPENIVPPLASAAAGLGARGRYADTVDSILYESADSYTQSRLIYMQNRRFKLGTEDSSAEIDPFALDTKGF